MILRKCVFLLIIFFIACGSGYCQTSPVTKKDTLYYLLDTAKVPIKDRIIEIVPFPNSHSFYTYLIRTHCLVYQSDPNFMSVRNDPGEIIAKTDVDKISFISIIMLNNIICKEDDRFERKYQLYFIEHLPNGIYLKRKILLGALEHNSDDHVLIKGEKK